ncbi:hypothetical protein ABPG74_018501 [Tetrahymena malaccensis]
MNKGFNKYEMQHFIDDKVPFTESYNSSLIRLDSFDSEKEANKHSKKNDKKSLFLKYGPIDGNIIFKYGIDAKIGKKSSNKERTYTIYDEEKQLNFLKSQDIQRRKSAEGSLFGFLNKRIIALDNLAPFHPNYKPLIKLGQDKFLQDQSPSRRVKDSQKTRILQQRESIDMHGENRMQKRLSAIQKQNMLSNIVNNGSSNTNNHNNKIDYVLIQDSKAVADKIPLIALSQQKRNSKNGTFLKQIPSNTGSPSNASHSNLFHQTQTSFLALEKTPSKSASNQQQILNENPQKQNEDKLNFSSQENEQESNKNALNQRKKQLNEQQQPIQKTLVLKSRRTHTHQDLSDIQNNIANQNQKLNQIASIKQLKTLSKDDYSHSSPTNMAVFFSVHKNITKQSIQKYINQNGLSTTTTLGSTSFQEKLQQEKSLQTIDLTKKDDFRQSVAHNPQSKKDKLLPLNLTEKKQQKSSQQLFSSVYISQNPLYKKRINQQGKRVTLPDIHFQKTSPTNQQQILKTITQMDQKDREPLVQKSIGSTSNIQSPNNKSQKFDTTKRMSKKIDYRIGETQNLSKNTENSETKLNFRMQSLKQLKKQETVNNQTKRKSQQNQQFVK